MDIAVAVAARRAQADEWALVLVAEGLSPGVVRVPTGFAVCVPESELERAREVLDAYEAENPERPPPPEDPPPAPGAVNVAFGFSALLLWFFLRTGPRRAGVEWFDRGSADAALILGDEPWRVVTALTLHADLGHAVGNAISGGIFVGAACHLFGPGVGLFLVVAAGSLGNALNAIVRSHPHDSIGASTAVFGAVGVLAAHAVVRGRRRGRRGRRALVPLAAGLGILAMLGTAGERTDLWAHFFGLVAGALVGLPAARTFQQSPGGLTQLAAGIAAAGLVAFAWMQALAGVG